MKVGFILLAGGVGKRMHSNIPKQYLKISGKTIVYYSLEIATSMKNINHIVTVCSNEYRDLFRNYDTDFAEPGERRQDSVYNGFCALPNDCDIVLIHDGARPCITKTMIDDLIDIAKEYDAATIGMQIKYTLKESDSNDCVIKTLNRSNIWEIQTPQMVKYKTLKDGFKKAYDENITVTDDTSLAELINTPVKLIKGCYTNLKITTADDLKIAEEIIRTRK